MPVFDQSRIDALCRRNRISRLELFGSAAQGNARPDSDLDFLIEFEVGAKVGFLTLGRVKEELETITGRKVDLVPRNGLKPLIRDDVLAGARIVYPA